MLTTADVLTSSGKFPERPEKWPPTDAMTSEASNTAKKVNALLALFGQSRKVSSGYRPPEVNAKVGGAKHSRHITCQAADLEDPDRKLGAFCVKHTFELEKIGLWLENPAKTPGWVHVQTVAPPSGKRIFDP